VWGEKDDRPSFSITGERRQQFVLSVKLRVALKRFIDGTRRKEEEEENKN